MIKYHIIFRAKGKWALKRDGSVRATKIYRSKLLATIDAVKNVLKKEGIIYIHKKDGRIERIITIGGLK